MACNFTWSQFFEEKVSRKFSLRSLMSFADLKRSNSSALPELPSPADAAAGSQGVTMLGSFRTSLMAGLTFCTTPVRPAVCRKAMSRDGHGGSSLHSCAACLESNIPDLGLSCLHQAMH